MDSGATYCAICGEPVFYMDGQSSREIGREERAAQAHEAEDCAEDESP